MFCSTLRWILKILGVLIYEKIISSYEIDSINCCCIEKFYDQFNKEFLNFQIKWKKMSVTHFISNAVQCSNKIEQTEQPRWPSGLAPPGCDPGDPGSSPTSSSLHGACFSLCLCLCLSLSFSLSLSIMNKWIKSLKKNLIIQNMYLTTPIF